MNISEPISTNLQVIAENQKKVYDAGYEQGKAEGGEPDPELVKQADLLYRSTAVAFQNDTMTEIELDCANKTSFQNMFMNCRKLTTVKLINTNKVKNWNYCFYGTNSLTSIEELDFSSTTKIDFAGFESVQSVTHLRIVPNTIKCSAPFRVFSKLDDDSLWSIVYGLSDMTGQTAPTIQFHADVKAKLTEEQIATITGENWTLA